MKHLTFLLSIVLVFSFTLTTMAKDKDENWQQFSQNLVKTLKSQHDGLKQSAMQRVIQYSDKLDVKDAALDIYTIYRWHNNDKVRQLALVALYNTNYDWAINQIAKDFDIESSPALKRQMYFMVNNYFSTK
jgi:hypothetical protein